MGHFRVGVGDAVDDAGIDTPALSAVIFLPLGRAACDLQCQVVGLRCGSRYMLTRA